MLSVRKPLFIFGTRTRKASILETCWLLNVGKNYNYFSDKSVLVIWKLDISIRREFKCNFFAGLIFLKHKIYNDDDKYKTVHWR